VQGESYTYAADTGSANAYVIALSPAVTSYVAGQYAAVKIANANTGASTLDAGGGAKNILKWSGGSLIALASGDLPANFILLVKYDGTQWQALNIAGGSSVGTPVENEVVIFSGTGGALAHTPSVVSGYTQVKLYRDGQRLNSGAGNDFTWIGAAITLAVAATSANEFLADYWM
jgi:hypothetical protein